MSCVSHCDSMPILSPLLQLYVFGLKTLLFCLHELLTFCLQEDCESDYITTILISVFTLLRMPEHIHLLHIRCPQWMQAKRLQMCRVHFNETEIHFHRSLCFVVIPSFNLALDSKWLHSRHRMSFLLDLPNRSRLQSLQVMVRLWFFLAEPFSFARKSDHLG